MSFPDFDFGAVRPTDFAHLRVNTAVQRVNKLLSDVAIAKESFLTDLWSSMDAVIHLHECDVYSYQPRSTDDQDDDPMAFLTETLTENSLSSTSLLHHHPALSILGEKDAATDASLGGLPNTTIWTFNYFFVNKTAKRIVLFTCVESMRNHEPDMRDEDDHDNDDYNAMFVRSESTDVDFDLDPAAAPAGGIPVSTV
jgi:hypothetical protein